MRNFLIVKISILSVYIRKNQTCFYYKKNLLHSLYPKGRLLIMFICVTFYFCKKEAFFIVNQSFGLNSLQPNRTRLSSFRQCYSYAELGVIVIENYNYNFNYHYVIKNYNSLLF